MQVFSTIIPIFAVVILGWFARRRGFMPPVFLGPANQLVYYLAIPALIFRSISKAAFHTQFNMTVLLITLSSATLAYVMAKEMYADDEFAVAAISTSTLASILTYLAWLMAVGPKVLCFGLVDLVIENNHGS